MAAPKPKPKATPTPTKLTPKQVTASQQAASNKQFAATQARTAAASKKTGYKDPATGRITVQTRGGITKLAARAPAPSRTTTRPAAAPKTTILGQRGQSNISAALAAGASRKHGALSGKVNQR